MSEKEMVKKSIFRQKTLATRYFVGKENYYNVRFYICKNEHKEEIKEEEIFICDLEMPMLEIGEKFYIEELNKLVRICDRVRTSKENVVYYIENEYIEDEETKKSLQKCEEAIKDSQLYNDKIRDMENKIEKFNNSWLGRWIKL